MNSSPVRVSLTYDGTTKCHLELAVPMLQKHGLPATFFVDALNLLGHVRAWQEVAEMGHEFGNGCLINAANPDGALPLWTPEMLIADVEENDQLIWDLGLNTGVIPFAYPSESAFLGDRIMGRVLDDQVNVVGEINPHQLSSCRYAPERRNDFQPGSWVILAFDRVDSASHEELLLWIKNQPNFQCDTLIGTARELSLLSPRSSARS